MKTIIIAFVFYLLVPFYCLSNPSVTSVPFYIIGNLVIVQASVNGKTGLFIMDTGVSEIILNNRYFYGKPTGDNFHGISGSEMEKKVNFIKINLDGFERRALAIITDFSALEKSCGLELLGVIGNCIFKNNEVVFDYTFKELTIYQLDKKGKRLSSKQLHMIPADTLHFTLRNGVPSVDVQVNGKLLKMSVDSGATANVMGIHELNMQHDEFMQLTEQSLIGWGSKKVIVKSRKIENIRVGNHSCPPMKTLFVNLQHFNNSHKGKKVDGILGYEFMSNFRVAINFKKSEIYLWDRKTVELQWALASKKEAYNYMIK